MKTDVRDKLEIADLHLRYGPVEVLKGIDARFTEGEVVCLLGRSGSGKTTLLRAIAGLEQPGSGAIRLDGRPIFDAAARVNLPPEARGLGLVFQSYALWPHRTVAENVAYGLRLRGRPRAEIERRVAEALEGVGLGALGGRYPSQLSGGQQQRVALARALVYEPPVILLDEPLSNLDAKLREEARIWIRSLIKRLGLTAVFVTHDQVEAMAIADRIVLLEQGRIVQDGPPQVLYQQPASLFAAEFMGSNNLWPTVVEEVRDDFARVSVAGIPLWGHNRGGRRPGEQATAVIRLERVALAEAGGDNRIAAELETSVYLGDRFEHIWRAGEVELRAFAAGPAGAGQQWLSLPAEALWIF
ncbi:Fe(3+) ions import ATP-binding protein FbpC [Rhodovastum atsumiense]|uniref:ABC transporter ATP-binding protein n=1 Tax=Rhodovastum atsumiense TaxID=504468 RepID=A0A5M6J233_9PROT|nr:ABC transporter ATP-binding protein [Rhodovastum atsumiense]KAA5613658.1 ABC transporter ATP-binding protein [Rhodovastum atsumiense]CAH2599568.1 Fe(3+) ions import ATP-binding protein FbpC [Rhodovastum atsumiense]